jgi:ubiquinone/menaquinone biosynthesis C-methylase UbiE
MRGDPAFNIYSSMRVQAQKMVWASVADGVARDAARLEAIATEAGADAAVHLNPDFVPPRNASAIDVHLMPGSYTGGEGMAAGATYDRGLAVFSMGLMGANLDDIGLSMAAYIHARYPDFAPTAILDTGCTIGHNSLPWKLAYPDATLTGIDVAAPGLRYAAARAKLQGVDAAFVQMASDALDFPDASFDLVFSSMFLHELPKKVRAKTFQEAYRVLRPGGLMLHMELPPNGEMAPFEAFYLDWDSYYNNEPYYKGYRDEDPRALCAGGGFEAQDYFQFVVPSIGIYGANAVNTAATSDATPSVGAETTGRLAEGVMWFGYGAWKR